MINIYFFSDVTISTRGINGFFRRTRRYKRPDGIYPSYFYMVYEVVVRRTGYYTFNSNSTTDLLGYLYEDNFFAARASDNLLRYDDNSGGNGQFEFFIELRSPVTYYLVVTTSERRVTGHFRVSVTGRVNALLVPVLCKNLLY